MTTEPKVKLILLSIIYQYVSVSFLYNQQNKSAQNLYSFGDFEILFLTTVSPVRVDLWETIIIIR